MRKFYVISVLLLLIVSYSFAVTDLEMFNEAQEDWNNRKYEDCLEVCQHFLTSFPDSELLDDILFIRGKCFYYLWDKENALDKTEHTYKIEDAVNSFQQILDQFEDSVLCPEALMWIGNCYYFTEEYETAIETYRKLIQDYPAHSEAKNARYRIAKSYEKEKQYSIAIENYEKVIQDYPDTPIAKQAEHDIKRINKLLSE